MLVLREVVEVDVVVEDLVAVDRDEDVERLDVLDRVVQEDADSVRTVRSRTRAHPPVLAQDRKEW